MNVDTLKKLNQKKSSAPLVSVIIPAYNRVHLTIKTIDSVLNQTYANIEVIVVDDGSKDDTKERLAVYGDKIKYVWKENGGACSARNVGIKMAKGQYLALLDCDDIFLPEKVEESIAFLEENPDYGFVHTDTMIIDGEDKVLGVERHPRAHQTGWIKEKLITSNFVSNSTVILRSECIEKSGLFAEDLFPPADWDMWLRLSEHYKVGYIPKPLTKYRASSNGCFNDLDRSSREYTIVLDRFFKRNPDVSDRVKRQAYAKSHMIMARYYIALADHTRAKEALKAAFRLEKFNIKSIVMYLYYKVAPKSLKNLIIKKFYLDVK